MAIHTRTFTFASNAEGWAATPESPMTMAYDAGGFLRAELAVGANDTTGFWRWNGDFGDLGVPSEAEDIVAIRVSFDYELFLLNRGIAGSTSFNVDTDNFLAVLRETSNTTDTRTSDYEPVTYDYSDSILLEIPIRLETSGQNPPGNRYVRIDISEIRIDVEYTEPAAISATATLVDEPETFAAEVDAQTIAEVSAGLVDLPEMFFAEAESVLPADVSAGLVDLPETFTSTLAADLGEQLIYFAGNRIAGIGSLEKPTNVPEGTLFSELDGDRDEFIFVNGNWEKY